MVTPLSRAIEKYAGGLPLSIQDTVLGSRPATLEEAIRLAATLTDNHVKSGILTRKGAKKSHHKTTPESTKPEPSFNRNKKHKPDQNYAIVTPATPINQFPPQTQTPNKKPYIGNLPQCNTCKYHHPLNLQCRSCTSCGRYGHLAKDCRILPMNQVNQNGAPAQNALVNVRACYNCGDPNHMRYQCPRLGNQANGNLVARGRVFNLNTTEVQPDQIQIYQPHAHQTNEAQAGVEVVNGLGN